MMVQFTTRSDVCGAPSQPLESCFFVFLISMDKEDIMGWYAIAITCEASMYEKKKIFCRSWSFYYFITAYIFINVLMERSKLLLHYKCTLQKVQSCNNNMVSILCAAGQKGTLQWKGILPTCGKWFNWKRKCFVRVKMMIIITITMAPQHHYYNINKRLREGHK